MSRNRKQPFWMELIGVSVRSYILWFARVLITSWYVYFAIHLDLRGGGYFAIAMVVLSIFGLVQLIELTAKFIGLKDRAPQPEPRD